MWSRKGGKVYRALEPAEQEQRGHKAEAILVTDTFDQAALPALYGADDPLVLKEYERLAAVIRHVQAESSGGFDTTFRTSEDRDLCDRWLHHAYRMIYAPEVIVSHAHPLTLRTFWRQH